MKRQYMNPNEQRLAAELKGEAERAGPGFSQMLHERIMREVGAAEAVTESGPQWNMRWVWGAAAAAMIVVGVWMWGRGLVGQRPGGTQVPVIVKKDVPPVPAVDELFGQTAASAFAKLDAKLDESKLAYLDQDAKRLAQFVMDRTRVFPLPK